MEATMEALIEPTDIPGLFNLTIPATGEFLTDLTTGQVQSLIVQRGLIPAQ
jgi:hypothetical protein